MQRGFGIPLYVAGGGGGELKFQGDCYADVAEKPAASAATMGFDDAFLNGCFSELSFQSLLQPTPPPVFQDSASDYGYMQQMVPRPSYSTENPPPPASSCNCNVFTGGRYQDVGVPKRERFDCQEFAFQLLNMDNNHDNTAKVSTEPLINFFSTADDVTGTAVSAGNGSIKSPERSIAFQTGTPAYYQAGYLSDIFATPSQELTLESPPPSSSHHLQKKRYGPYPKGKEESRERRKRISEKIKRLGELLPCVHKKDMGTVLEETYKYVKFLEAQVRVLQAPPLQTATTFPPPPPPPSKPNPEPEVIRRPYHTNSKYPVGANGSSQIITHRLYHN